MEGSLEDFNERNYRPLNRGAKLRARTAEPPGITQFKPIEKIGKRRVLAQKLIPEDIDGSPYADINIDEVWAPLESSADVINNKAAVRTLRSRQLKILGHTIMETIERETEKNQPLVRLVDALQMDDPFMQDFDLNELGVPTDVQREFRDVVQPGLRPRTTAATNQKDLIYDTQYENRHVEVRRTSLIDRYEEKKFATFLVTQPQFREKHKFATDDEVQAAEAAEPFQLYIAPYEFTPSSLLLQPPPRQETPRFRESFATPPIILLSDDELPPEWDYTFLIPIEGWNDKLDVLVSKTLCANPENGVAFPYFDEIQLLEMPLVSRPRSAVNRPKSGRSSKSNQNSAVKSLSGIDDDDELRGDISIPHRSSSQYGAETISKTLSTSRQSSFSCHYSGTVSKSSETKEYISCLKGPETIQENSFSTENIATEPINLAGSRSNNTKQTPISIPLALFEDYEQFPKIIGEEEKKLNNLAQSKDEKLPLLEIYSEEWKKEKILKANLHHQDGATVVIRNRQLKTRDFESERKKLPSKSIPKLPTLKEIGFFVKTITPSAGATRRVKKDKVWGEGGERRAKNLFKNQ
ncbi:hypothetical protein HK100_011784 [Physocladia obscura]|uniref:Transcriptional regulatory protein RXT2 N-terminal domain-containing protein n=1 Tax=Physocladia obscura TaxID=109957 RepID=A0AAD5XI32_9FUNG|nr:hypothetical protein HK100_011784 [Physocladia obscura]